MIPEAKPIDQIKASRTEGDNFKSAVIYTIEGKPGLWRSVARERRTGITTPHENRVVAYEGDKLLELERWTVLELALHTQANLGELPEVIIEGACPCGDC